MAAKLKVFRYCDGFHAWTVAASSRPKALAAWGVKRDLFKDGSAEEVDEGPDYEAALKAPGELIERGLAVDVGKVVREAAPKRSKADEKARARVEALEAELASLDEVQAGEREALAAKRAELEKAAAALEKTQEKARAALKARLKAAREKL